MAGQDTLARAAPCVDARAPPPPCAVARPWVCHASRGFLYEIRLVPTGVSGFVRLVPTFFTCDGLRCPDILGTVCVVLISQEQLERMVEGAEAEIVDRHFTDRRHHPPGEAPSARTLSSQADVRRLLRAALRAGGVEVGVDPRLERLRAEQAVAVGERRALLDRYGLVVAGGDGPDHLLLSDGDRVYRVAGRLL